MTAGRLRGDERGWAAALAHPTVRALVLAALALPLHPLPTHGQEPVTAVLRGDVSRDGAPVANQTVQLHRVSAETAGEIDSVATAADGTFRFVLPRLPSPSRQEVYFASTRYSGVLYFGRPISTPADLDSTYALEVHDTVSAPAGGATLPLAIRTMFMEPAEEGWIVTDLFEVRNDGSRTLVAREGGAVWSYPLFEGASDVELGDGDVGPDAFRFADGRVRISAPIPPGSRLYVFRYAVASLEGTLPFPGTADRVELLIREPAPLVAVAGLAAAPPVEIEPGNAYRRFVGSGVTESVVSIVATEPPPSIPFGWLVVSLGLALAALGLWATQRTGPLARDELLVEVARLDESFAAVEDPRPRDRARYERRRARLLRRLQRG